MRACEHVPALRRAVASALLLAGLVVGCGARSDTITEQEMTEPDCAAEDKRLLERCQTTCGTTELPGTACIDGCFADARKACEATASCRCSLALTKLSSD